MLGPARLIRAGRSRASVAAATVGAGPDEAVAVVLVVEEVGVDRRVEARVVELQAEIVAPLVGALGPGGADLGAAHDDPVGGGVPFGLAGVGNDAVVPGLAREGDNDRGAPVGAG